MRKFIFFILVIVSFASCKTINVDKITEGRFSKSNDYFFVNSRIVSEHVLVLNKNGTFLLELRYSPVVINKCQGRWYYLDNKNIHLKCDEPTIVKDTCMENIKPVAVVDPSWVKGYMQARERNVKVINKNKIQVELPEADGSKYVVMERYVER